MSKLQIVIELKNKKKSEVRYKVGHSMEKERKLDQFLQYTVEIGEIKFQMVDLLFILCLSVVGLLIRIPLYPITSADYLGCLLPWMEEIRQTGGFFSLNHSISNYTSPYMYLMCLVSYVTRDNLYALKTVSVIFDYVAALAMFLLVYEITCNVRRSIIGMALVLICPTVIINSAYWCQCDVIYTSFLLWSLLYFYRDNSRKSLVFMGIAFSFKLQALFFVPFLILMWLKGRTIKFRHFLYIPAMYVLTAVPAWLFGRSMKDLLLIYVQQSETYPWGTLEYPNIYALLGEVMPDYYHANEVSSAGTFMTIILLGLLAYYLYGKRIIITNQMAATIALFSVALVVYTLPHMHDRYGFLVDLLAILYGVLNPGKLMMTCLFLLVSLLSYIPYLLGIHIMPIAYVALGLLALLLLVGKDLYGQIKAQESSL